MSGYLWQKGKAKVRGKLEVERNSEAGMRSGNNRQVRMRMVVPVILRRVPRQGCNLISYTVNTQHAKKFDEGFRL
jgi:hypothetical protein